MLTGRLALARRDKDHSNIERAKGFSAVIAHGPVESYIRLLDLRRPPWRTQIAAAARFGAARSNPRISLASSWPSMRPIALVGTTDCARLVELVALGEGGTLVHALQRCADSDEGGQLFRLKADSASDR